MKKNNIYVFQGILLLIFAQAMVGLNIVCSKYLLTSIPIMLMLTIRFAIASVILLPLHWLTPARNVPFTQHLSQLTRKDWIFIVAQSMTAGFLFNVLMLLGLHYTDANVAGIITSILPIIIAAMSWLVLRETISRQKGICVVFASMGLVVIACNKWQGIGASHSVLGDVIVLLSLLPEAAYYVLCKVHVNRLPIFLTASLLNGLNAVMLLGVLYFTDTNDFAPRAYDWLILVILGLSSGLFYVFWFFGCLRVDGGMASLSTAVMPMTTVLFAWAFLSEQLTLVQCAGMGLVILSIILYARQS